MKRITLLIAFLFAVCLNHNYAQNTWKKKAPCGGLGRWAAVGFSIGNKGYIGTGVNGRKRLLRDFWEYDPSTNAWTQKADFGGGKRYGAVGFSIGNKGYVGTGGVPPTGYNDFWEYDPATNVWTRKADFGGSQRRNAVGFSIGSKGYIGTGGNDLSFKKDFWEYDPATDVWTRKAAFEGGGRENAVGFSIGSKGYLGTGSGGGTNFYKDFWEYDPATNAWTRKTDFGGTERYTPVGFSIGTKGYIGLGFFDLDDFWEYDPTANSWTQKANFGGTGRAYALGFSIGNKGYMGAGVYSVGVKDFWEYTPDNTCPSPGGLMAVRIEDTAAVLKWHLSGANISNVWLRYRAAGDPVWLLRKRDASTTNLRIHGLMPNTTYQWQVRSLCTEDTSAYIKGPDFTTAASFAFSSTTSAITSSKSPGNIHVQIMPNPNKGNFTIQAQLPAEAAITTLALYNNMGEKVWQQDAGRISGAVYKNISLQNQLPAGTYMMVIRRNDVRLEQKIVISK